MGAGVRKVRGLFVCAVVALVAWPGVAGAAALRCGDAVTGDTVLTADVRGCGATGLVIAADGVTLDLNGHTVSGNRLGFGIVVSGRRNVTIRNGTVSRFRVGISVGDATDFTAQGLALTDGHDGVVFFRVTRGTIARSSFTGNDGSAIFPRISTAIRVLDNRAWGNAAGFTGLGLADGVVSGNEAWGQTYYGLIFLDVTGSTFSDNRFEHNGTLGMQVGGDSSGNLVARNRAWRNGGDGIEVDGLGDTLTKNTAFFNGGFGIDAAAGAIDGGGNHAKHNGAPLECAGVACK